MFVTGTASACPTIDVKSALYDIALATVMKLPEFQSWVAEISKKSGAHVAIDSLPPERQILIARICFVPITLYSDEGTHLHNWNTFYVNVKSD